MPKPYVLLPYGNLIAKLAIRYMEAVRTLPFIRDISELENLYRIKKSI